MGTAAPPSSLPPSLARSGSARGRRAAARGRGRASERAAGRPSGGGQGGDVSMSAAWTLPPAPLPPSTGPPGAGLDAEQRTVFAFVLCLLVVLVLLMVRCVRILLDPYSRMPASSWTDHKEALERGQFDYALV